VQARET